MATYSTNTKNIGQQKLAKCYNRVLDHFTHKNICLKYGQISFVNEFMKYLIKVCFVGFWKTPNSAQFMCYSICYKKDLSHFD